MPTVNVSSPDVSRDQAMQAVRKELGEGFVVEPGRHEDVFSVNKGTMTGAKVHIKHEDGATQFHVHGTGIIIGRLINELVFARRVAAAISKSHLD